MKEMHPELAKSLAALGEKQYARLPTDRELAGYKLVCTCSACPEQYDVFNSNGEKVGYLRLRHGWFRADAPACGGTIVYESRPKGDGIFDEDERVPELTKALDAITKYWKEITE